MHDPQNTLKALRLLETELSFDQFSHADALALAMSIISRVKSEGKKPVGIRITLRGILVFQYLMDGKKNDIWLLKKEKTVALCGHSSHYAYLNHEADGSYSELANDESCALTGGGFPIFEQGTMIGIISVSGLTSEEDHQLITDALKEKKKTGIQ